MNFGREDFAKLSKLVKYIWVYGSSGLDAGVVDNQPNPFVLEEGLSFIIAHVGGDILSEAVGSRVEGKRYLITTSERTSSSPSQSNLCSSCAGRSDSDIRILTSKAGVVCLS